MRLVLSADSLPCDHTSLYIVMHCTEYCCIVIVLSRNNSDVQPLIGQVTGM